MGRPRTLTAEQYLAKRDANHKAYYEKNKERIKEYRKARYQKQKESLKLKRQMKKEYNQK